MTADSKKLPKGDITVVPGKSEKLFYGWVIVSVATLMYLIMGGPITAFGIFVKPMAEDLGLGRTAIAGGFMTFMVTMGIFSVLGGILSDRFGPKKIVATGGLLLCLGLCLVSKINSQLQFYLAYGVIGGMGFSFLYVPLTATISRWFVTKNGMALGIFFAGAGIGGLILSPLIEVWISAYGWRTTFIIVGGLTGGIIVPLSFFLKGEPSEMGLKALGAVEHDNPSISNTESTPGVKEYTVAEAFKTRDFYANLLAGFLTFSTIMMVQINLVPYATDRGISGSTAATALGLAAFFNALGRLFMGALSDKIGTKRAMGICVITVMVMLFWLIKVNQPWMLFLFAPVFGFAYGGTMPQTPRIISELFGKKSMGSILGISSLIGALGPAVGPVIGTVIYDRTGSYTGAFILGGIFTLTAFALFMSLNLVKPANR